MATYRYPSDISSSNSTFLIFTRAENRGFTSTELRNITQQTFKSITKSSLGMPIPNGITDNSGVSYSNIQDASILTQLAGKAYDKLAGSGAQQQGKLLEGKTKALQSALIFENVPLKAYTFTWDIIPESAEEMKDIENIIKEFELGKLPTYASKITMNFPDVWKITFGGVQPKLIRFLPCVITNISAIYGGDSFQMYEDGGFTSISLTVSFQEIAGRSREIQQSLYNR